MVVFNKLSASFDDCCSVEDASPNCAFKSLFSALNSSNSCSSSAILLYASELLLDVSFPQADKLTASVNAVISVIL